MKLPKLLGLGIILAVTGLTWLLNISAHVVWYTEKTSNEAVFAICLILSILMAIGGFICIFAAFDRYA